MAVNVGSFVGAGTVRAYAKGMAEGPATPAELDTMRRVVRDAMLDGALGLGSALIYPPGSYASTTELIEEAKAMAPYGGVYITHMRSEGDHLVEAVDEAIRIGREGGVPVEIYHLKAAGVKNWPKAKQVVAKIDSARAAGQDVAADQYPYVAGQNNLSSCIPAVGARRRQAARSAARQGRRATEIKTEMMDGSRRLGEPLPRRDAAGRRGRRIQGRLTEEVRRQAAAGDRPAWGKDWADALIDLTLAREERARAGDLRRVGLQRRDAGAAAVDEVRHRRRGVRSGDSQDLDASARVRHLSAHPRPLRARRAHPHARGRGAEDDVGAWPSGCRFAIAARCARGCYADIMIFDPTTIIDRATYEAPHQLSVGMRWVFVNGVAVVSDGKVTGEKPGRLVRGPGWRGN